MVAILINLYLFSFWLDKSIGFHLEEILGVGDGFSLPNLCIYLMICVWGILQKYRHSLLQKTNANVYIYLLMILTAFSIVLNYYGHNIKSADLIKYIIAYKNLITPWLLFFLITSLIPDIETCEKLIRSLILFLVITVLAILVENIFGIDFGTKGVVKSYRGRSSGFSEANQYAGFLVLFIPLFLSNIYLYKDWSTKIKGCLLLLLGVFGMISTVSKGGFISFFVSMMYFFRMNIRERMIELRLVVASMCLLILFFGASFLILTEETKEVAKMRLTLQDPEYKNKYHKDFLKKQSWAWRLTSGRTNIWEDTFNLIAKKPFWGHGYGSDKLKFELSTHSDPLKWLVNNGIVGLLIFLIIYAQIYRYVLYHYRTTFKMESRRFYICYLSGFVGYTVAMLGVNMYEPRYIFWIYTAVVYSHIRLDVDKAEIKQ